MHIVSDTETSATARTVALVSVSDEVHIKALSQDSENLTLQMMDSIL